MATVNFPHQLSQPNIPASIIPDTALQFHLASGEQALRLLLRSYKQKSAVSGRTKVAIPAFVCEAVPRAVEDEGLMPLYLDLRADGSFWTNYAISDEVAASLVAVILVHPYGFIHPDTQSITTKMHQLGIPLIHDATPSYGINESPFNNGDPVVYSFGPGKSSTAGFGGWIKNLDETTFKTFYLANVRQPASAPMLNFLLNQRARLALVSRTYGRGLTVLQQQRARWVERCISIIRRRDEAYNLYGMSSLQLQAASYVLQQLPNSLIGRQERYQVLQQAINNHPLMRLAYANSHGVPFKMVLYCQEHEQFKDYLLRNYVPFFRQAEQLEMAAPKYAGLTHFKNQAPKLFEFSTELTIPLSEIRRIAELLRSFR